MPTKKKTMKKPAFKKAAPVKAKKPPRPFSAKKTAEPDFKLDRDKYIALWAGVIFFMAIIIFIWAFNFKKSVSAGAKNSGSNQEFSKMASDLNEAFFKAANNLNQLKEGVSGNNSGNEQSEVSDLQRRLSELEQRIELEKFLYQFNHNLNSADIAGQ